ncbi:helicase c2 [gut metagenome]|uniref:Helicase c2 n=1 Tax=gut metagenome TaxID=749906 RepID=J9GZP9_9ZZZZ
MPENDPLWPLVTSTRESCLGKDRCPCWDRCFVKQAREKALKSQVVVVNHHLYISSMALKAESDSIDGMLPKADLTVIDEAHQMASVACSFFGEVFSTRELEELMQELRQVGLSKVRDGADWNRLYDNVVRGVRNLRLEASLIGLTEGCRRALKDIPALGELHPAMQIIREAMLQTAAALRENAGRDEAIDNLAERHDLLTETMKVWLELIEQFRQAPEGTVPAMKADGYVRWIEATPHTLRFNATPLSIAEAFDGIRSTEGGAWVFTSATLSSNRDFTHFKHELGITEATEASWDSPFNYWEQGCFYIPEMPDPQNNTIEHTRHMVEIIWPLIAAAQGRTFLLCTSLTAVREAARLVSERLEANGNPYSLFVQGEAPKIELIERFREDGHGILIGSKSFWEGVDVKGEALALVVVDKMPFTSPDDPVAAARGEVLKAAGKSPFFLEALPEAVITLRQGAGRLIRSEEDRGMFVLCDPRILKKGYGKTVINSLPDFLPYTTQRKSTGIFPRAGSLRRGALSLVLRFTPGGRTAPDSGRPKRSASFFWRAGHPAKSAGILEQGDSFFFDREKK